MDGYLYLNSERDTDVENSKGELIASFLTRAAADEFISRKNREIQERRFSSTETFLEAPLTVEHKAVFEGGATRSAMKERYDLVPAEAVAAIARRLALGAEKHGENNWRAGGPEFRKATISHLLKHLLNYIENGNADDANTDAIICNAAFLCHFEAREPFAPKLP
jgi:hypothetical protein